MKYGIALVIIALIAMAPYSTFAQYGGGGGGTATSFKIINSFITNLSGKTPDANIMNICFIERISFVLDNEASQFVLSVLEITKPTNIPSPPYHELCYYAITVPTSIKQIINQVNFNLKISKTDLQGFDKESVSLYRFNELTNKWEAIPTEIINEDATHVYYSATGTSLSFFALTVQEEVQPPPPIFSKTFTVEGFDVPVTITDGSVESIEANIEEKSLDIMLSNVNEDAILTIEIPRGLLDATDADGNDSQFSVISNGNFLEFTETKTDGKRILKINIPANTEMVRIVGTFIIPEFGIIAMMVLGISMVGLIIALRSNIKL